MPDNDAIRLELDDSLLIGAGTLRACYLHPHDPGLIVKVPLPDRDGGDRANHAELSSYRALSRAHPDLDRVSHCHGLVATDRGAGLVCDCVRNHDGTVARTILETVLHQERCDIDQLLEVAGEFCDYLIARDLFLFDINLKNVVLQSQADGTLRAVAVDLKGPCDNKEFLRLSSRIRFLGRRKLKRRARELLARIVLFRDQREILKKLAV